ncbi:putative acetyltransferase, partial [Cellulomonas rhizosphaerae]
PAPDEPPFTDVLGDLLSVDDAGVLIGTRHGEVRVPAADIVLSKQIPPAPPRRGPR